jgi:hypothetical protein
LAPYLVNFLLNRVVTLSPGKRVIFDVPQWMDAVLVVAKDAGFEQKYAFNRMGLVL